MHNLKFFPFVVTSIFISSLTFANFSPLRDTAMRIDAHLAAGLNSLARVNEDDLVKPEVRELICHEVGDLAATARTASKIFGSLKEKPTNEELERFPLLLQFPLHTISLHLERIELCCTEPKFRQNLMGQINFYLPYLKTQSENLRKAIAGEKCSVPFCNR